MADAPSYHSMTKQQQELLDGRAVQDTDHMQDTPELRARLHELGSKAYDYGHGSFLPHEAEEYNNLTNFYNFPRYAGSGHMTREDEDAAMLEHLQNNVGRGRTEETYAAGGYTKPIRIPHRDSGGIVDKALQAVGQPKQIDPLEQTKQSISQYKDPESAISHWDWRPLNEVHEKLGNITEIPSHVQNFGDFMDATAQRAQTQGLTPRDLVKAYAVTLASIQRKANPVDKVRLHGLALPNLTGKIRPEGAMGEWLHTPAGQSYLDAASRGQIHENAIADMARKLRPFGMTNKLSDSLRWGAINLPGKEGLVSQLVAAGREKASTPDEWRDFAKGLKGIDVSKAGFIASMLGRGDQPTFDARQRILQTGIPSGDAGKMISGVKMNPKARAAVDRLAARQSALNFTLPERLSPYYQHLAHHTIWDKDANEVTTHQDVIDAMQHAARGGAITDHPLAIVLQSLHPKGFADGGMPQDPASATPAQPQYPVKYKSWDDVPTIDPQHLVGKKVFPIFADLTKAGSAFSGIDSAQLKQPEQLYGGPGYPLLPEAQQHGLGWAVEGKGRGTSKLLKDADYIAVSAMEPYSHQSNASFSNSLMKNMAAYVDSKKITPENVNAIDNMVRRPTEQKELQGLDKFPGFAHPDAEKFLRGMTFEQRKRISQVLASKEAQDLGAPNIDKITRATLDPQFAGVPSRHAMFLLQVPKTPEGMADEDRLKELLVNLKNSGLPEHPSYQYGMKGHIVGKFHHSVAPEVLFKDWFDQKRAEEATAATDAKAKNLPAPKTNTRRAFDLAMPVVKVSQEVADMLPRHPRDIQSGKAAQLALNAFNDRWDTTETPVGKGGLGPAALSQALKNSDSSSTLSQYSPDEIKNMVKSGQFTGYKLKDGEVYFGLKRGTNYKEDYGFEHPDLTPNETALVSVVNNEPGAKGIGGAPVVLKAIQHGATALDAYAVPSKKHPDGFLPRFYSQFGFEELGRIPFDPQYVSEEQLADMKHEWTKAGWDETMGMPSLAIMKWRGSDGDRQDAVRKFVHQSSKSDRPGTGTEDVLSAARALEQGTGPDAGEKKVSGSRDPGRDRGGLRDDSAARSPDRFSRTLSEIKQLSPSEMKHFGLDPAEVEAARPHLAHGGHIDAWEFPHRSEALHFASGGSAMEPPKKTVKAYKLFRTDPKKPGQIFPLFVDAKTPVPMNEWVTAKAGDPGKTAGRVKSSLGDLAYRPGWHSGDLPIATHIGGKSDPALKAPDYRPDNQVWAEVEHPADVDWQSVANSRMEYTKDGRPKPVTAHITDQVPLGGFYRYKTNPNMTGNWLISGGMKVNRILGDDEVKSINDAAGMSDLPRLPKAGGGAAYPLDESSDEHRQSNGKMTWMSPNTFLDKAQEMRGDKDDKHVIKHFEKRMEQGDKLNALALYPKGGQDGRHRATAAKHEGIKKIPVVQWPKKRAGGSIVERALMLTSKKA